LFAEYLPTYLEEDERGAAHQRVNGHHREAVEPQQQGAHSGKLNIQTVNLLFF
jgi:hypothetical protein